MTLGVNSNVFSITREGETADIQHYLNEHKISEESQYDGLYAVCTDLLDDEVSDILKVSEGRWQIEECFRIVKTDFSARPVYLRDYKQISFLFLSRSKKLILFLTWTEDKLLLCQ